jgi:hypothetical protein
VWPVTAARPLAAVRDGAVVVAAGLTAAFVAVALASLAYRPRGHVGSVLDWLRLAVYVLALAVGAPLRLQSGTDHGRVALVPLTITAVLVVAAFRRSTPAAGVAVVAAALMAVLALVSGSQLSSYGRHLTLHYVVPAWPSALGMAVVVLLAGLARWVLERDDGWTRAVRGCLAGLAVTGAVAAVTAVVIDLVKFRATWGFAPGLLGDGAAWLGGFSLGGRIEADLSSPIPFLSGDLGAGLVSGGAWPAAYALVVVPLVAAVVAGRFQRVDPARAWSDFGRAAVVNAVAWLVLVEASRLRFSGRLGEDVLSGSAGLDVASTVFVAALWGAAGAALGLALAPRTHPG